MHSLALRCTSRTELSPAHLNTDHPSASTVSHMNIERAVKGLSSSDAYPEIFHIHGAMNVDVTCATEAVAAKVIATETASIASRDTQILRWVRAGARRACETSAEDSHGRANRNDTIRAEISTLSEPQKLIGEFESISIQYYYHQWSAKARHSIFRR